MELKEAQLSLENELKEPLTDVQKPLTYKYARWRIIDYLWTSYSSNADYGDSLEWLKELYRNAGMTDGNMSNFVNEVELIMETIERTH